MYEAEINTSALLFHNSVQTLAANDTGSRWLSSLPAGLSLGFKSNSGTVLVLSPCTLIGRLFDRTGVTVLL